MVKKLTIDEEQPSLDKVDFSRISPKLDLISTCSFMAEERPRLQRNASLSEISAMYDRNGKGYLDDTERALRNLDAQNKGFLDIDKVYYIMETLRNEQKKSATLIDTIRKEQQKSLNLKKSIGVLCVFSILLALSNIGTSFAAARLAKDTELSSDNDLTNLKGERIGTTSKVEAITMQPLDMSQRRSRHLKTAESFTCSNVSNGVNCTIQGQINYDDAIQLMWQFCPGWPNRAYCAGGGVLEVELNCNGAISTILGGSNLPHTGPEFFEQTTVFPTRGQGYAAFQTFSIGFGLPHCRQDLDIAMYCPWDGAPCFVFSAYTPSCNQTVVLCGETTSD